jgi:DNA-binding CsgD family transcriptional regulator
VENQNQDGGRRIPDPNLGEVWLTHQEFNTLELLAKNPRLQIKILAREMRIEDQSVRNLLRQVYQKLELRDPNIAKRGAAIQWYNQVAKPYLYPEQTSSPDSRQYDLLTTAIRLTQRGNVQTILYTSAFFLLAVFTPIAIRQTRKGLFNNLANTYGIIPILGASLAYLQTRTFKTAFQTREAPANNVSNKYATIPILGVIIRFLRKMNTKGLYYFAIIKLCIGIAAWGIGNFIWLGIDYVCKHACELYPSPADIGYTIGAIFVFLGVLDIHNKIVGRLTTRNLTFIIWTIAYGIVCGLIVLMLRNFTFIPHRDPLKLALDIFYPVSDIATLGILSLIINYTASNQSCLELRRPIYYLIAGMSLYLIADTSFSITTLIDETKFWGYYTGNWTDFVFACTFCVLSIGIIKLPLQ